ncbi:MAG: single-stranded-DNA-specific exonuclease RecJ [Oscillospiraceae bacterium]|nr:single-stranded-DNA-specific exonuclease RecJ [Oscillospiraceae bacterium]
MAIKRWKLIRFDKSESAVLADKLKIPLMTADLLVARGVKTEEQAKSFLFGSNEFSDPMEYADMDKAVDRIRKALYEDERICVYGDYDCDGVTATVLLYSYFEDSGADVIYYIPDRYNEGYGLNKKAIDRIKKAGVNLIVTVDNGISAVEEIDYAAKLGIDVVVTDHHMPPAELPNAVAVVDPHRADCNGAFKELAGVGVAFKLVCALEGENGETLIDQYGDLAALGTIADVVPLLGENRIIAKCGVESIQYAERVGIKALLKISGLEDKEITAENISFGLAPRINSSARIGTAEAAVNLLITDDDEYAEELAEELLKRNKERQELERGIMAQIEEYIAAQPEVLLERVLVLCGEGWHHGVIGIVCSRMVERFGKPCVLISINGEEARGSARSVEGFSMVEAVSSCKEYLTRYGGHASAAGVSMNTSDIVYFKEQMQKYAEEKHPIMPVYTINIDRMLEPDEVEIEAIKSLSILEPFGCRNESPVFAFRKLKIDGIYPIGDNKHIRIKFIKERSTVYAVYFGMRPESFPYKKGDIVDAVASCDVNFYNGEERVNIKLKDVRLSSVVQDEIIEGRQRYESFRRAESCMIKEADVPKREQLAAVYRYLKEEGGFCFDRDELYCRVADRIGSYCALCVALDAFEETGLTESGANGAEAGSEAGIKIRNVTGKVDIEHSAAISMIRLRAEQAQPKS